MPSPPASISRLVYLAMVFAFGFLTAPATGAVREGGEHAAPATDLPSESTKQASDWTWNVRPTFWLAAASGEFRAGPRSDSRKLNNLNLDNPSAGFYLDAAARREDLRFSFDGFFFIDEGETRLRNSARMFGIALPVGQELDTSVQAWSLSGGAWYRVFDYARASDTTDHSMQFDLYAGGGVRVLGVDASIDVAGGPSGDESGFFAQAFAGVRIELLIDETFAFLAQADLGAGPFADEFTALHLTSGAEWRFTDNAALCIGYQHLDIDVDSGDLYWSGRVAGMYVGLNLTF